MDGSVGDFLAGRVAGQLSGWEAGWVSGGRLGGRVAGRLAKRHTALLIKINSCEIALLHGLGELLFVLLNPFFAPAKNGSGGVSLSGGGNQLAPERFSSHP